MRQRKTAPGISDEVDRAGAEAKERIEQLASPAAFGTGTWNTLNTARAHPQATLEWMIGDIGDGSIRVTVDNPTAQAIDRLADLAERFAELAL